MSSNKSKSKLYEMVVRGTNFREEYEFEMYGGESVKVLLQPLVDDEFLPIAAFLSSHLDMDVDEDEAVSEAIDKVDEAREVTELEDVEGIGDSMADALREAGHDDPAQLANASVDELTEIKNIGQGLAERIKEDAQEAVAEDSIDMSKLDEEFVAAMQQAATHGIAASFDEDGNEIEHDEEEAEWMVENMMGGYSVEIGGRVLEISGDVRDAEKFRGGRGSVERSRDS